MAAAWAAEEGGSRPRQQQRRLAGGRRWSRRDSSRRARRSSWRQCWPHVRSRRRPPARPRLSAPVPVRPLGWGAAARSMDRGDGLAGAGSGCALHRLRPAWAVGRLSELVPLVARHRRPGHRRGAADAGDPQPHHEAGAAAALRRRPAPQPRRTQTGRGRAAGGRHRRGGAATAARGERRLASDGARGRRAGAAPDGPLRTWWRRPLRGAVSGPCHRAADRERQPERGGDGRAGDTPDGRDQGAGGIVLSWRRLVTVAQAS
eukprot:COSAG01_NODE_619_length_14786_cov_73.363110_11_plen_261_part_00